MKKQIFVLGLVLLLMAGCANAPMTFEILQPAGLTTPVIFNTRHLDIKNEAPLEPIDPMYRNPYSSGPRPVSEETQRAFQEAIVKVVQNNFVSEGTENRAIIKINKTTLRVTNNGMKSVVFVGLFLLGMEESYIAGIEGIVEIENAQGQVIDKADFKIEKIVKGPNTSNEQVHRYLSEVINHALTALETEVKEKSQRYLYKHLKAA